MDNYTDEKDFAVLEDKGDDSKRITHWITYQAAKEFIECFKNKNMHIVCRMPYRYNTLDDYGKGLSLPLGDYNG